MTAKKLIKSVIPALMVLAFNCAIVSGAYAAVFSSKNGEYTVEVDSDFSIEAGKAHYKVKDESGEIISKFETDLSPIALMPLNNGKRIIGFYGGVGQTVVVTQVRFYSMKGELIGKYGIFATGTGGQDISENDRYYVYSWWNDKKSGIDLFDTQTGKKVWSKTFEKLVKGVKISGDGQWIVTMLSKGKSKEIYLLDYEGNLKWSGSIKASNDCSITSINEDGSLFEATENKMVYNEKDGYMHRTLVKKTVYANEDGEVKIEKIINPPPQKTQNKSH
ncbi:MAG: hypothetical protein KKD35_02000 [Elusimicrobia bacterium]|nr:hypothetical protein [Elusimicrobiota bacterium]